MTDIKTIISKTERFIKDQFAGEGTGHDWHHIDRVRNTALHLCEQIEEANAQKVELIALLHDLGDHKLNKGKDQSTEQITEFLTSIHCDASIIDWATENVKMVSFKGAGVASLPPSIVGQIVQDADRLDAIGAIGIARAFTYGGSKHRPMFVPNQSPATHQSFEEYQNQHSHTINHFHEKLLLLKNRMNTVPAKEMAEKRHVYMVQFLEQFHAEWEGTR